MSALWSMFRAKENKHCPKGRGHSSTAKVANSPVFTGRNRETTEKNRSEQPTLRSARIPNTLFQFYSMTIIDCMCMLLCSMKGLTHCDDTLEIVTAV